MPIGMKKPDSTNPKNSKQKPTKQNTSNKKIKNTANQTKKPVEQKDIEEVDDLFSGTVGESYEEDNKKSSVKSIYIIIPILIAIVCVAGFFIFNTLSKNQKDGVDVETSTDSSEDTTTSNETTTESNNPNAVYDDDGNLISENGVYDTDGNVIKDGADSVGLPNFSDDPGGKTTARYFSANDYVKDLNGLDIPAVYNVKSRTYIKDFVNYEAKRAIMDDGMELYWLEVLYKNRKYRVQCPFYIFKDLDETGICVVEIEVLNMEGGEKVISFMQVVQDYDDLINNEE